VKTHTSMVAPCLQNSRVSLFYTNIQIMKTLALALFVLALSYASPRAQMGARPRSRSIGTSTVRTTQTRTAPGTYRSTSRTRITTTRISPPVYRSYQYSSRSHTFRSRGIDNARLHGGVAHAYGLRHRRFARGTRER